MANEKELLQKLRGHLAYKVGMEPYKVFRDQELDLLLEKRPKTLEELAKLKGFPKDGARVTKYGKAIIDIFNRSGQIDDFNVRDDGFVETKLKRMKLV